MAEHAVTNIMDECGGKCDLGPLVMITGPEMSLDHLHQLSSGVQHANAVRKPGMGGTWKDELGKAELAYAPKPLEFWGLNDAPKHLIERIRLELDQVMHRVTDALAPWSRQTASSDSKSRASSVVHWTARPEARSAAARSAFSASRRASTSSRNWAGQ